MPNTNSLVTNLQAEALSTLVTYEPPLFDEIDYQRNDGYERVDEEIVEVKIHNLGHFVLKSIKITDWSDCPEPRVKKAIVLSLEDGDPTEALVVPLDEDSVYFAVNKDDMNERLRDATVEDIESAIALLTGLRLAKAELDARRLKIVEEIRELFGALSTESVPSYENDWTTLYHEEQRKRIDRPSEFITYDVVLSRIVSFEDTDAGDEIAEQNYEDDVPAVELYQSAKIDNPEAIAAFALYSLQCSHDLDVYVGSTDETYTLTLDLDSCKMQYTDDEENKYDVSYFEDFIEVLEGILELLREQSA